MFGSVPLRTYLPDGDIDLALFQKSGPSIRDFWQKKLANFLEAEQRKPGLCTVKDVQPIAAEVRLPSSGSLCMHHRASMGSLLPLQVPLLKCLVDDIVVDISFQTLGGLCTVAFLESIDRKLQEDNLFKRSIILVSGTPSVMHLALLCILCLTDAFEAGQGLVLLREPPAGGAPQPAVHLCPGDHGAVRPEQPPQGAAQPPQGATALQHPAPAGRRLGS